MPCILVNWLADVLQAFLASCEKKAISVMLYHLLKSQLQENVMDYLIRNQAKITLYLHHRNLNLLSLIQCNTNNNEVYF